MKFLIIKLPFHSTKWMSLTKNDLRCIFSNAIVLLFFLGRLVLIYPLYSTFGRVFHILSSVCCSSCLSCFTFHSLWFTVSLPTRTSFFRELLVSVFLLFCVLMALESRLSWAVGSINCWIALYIFSVIELKVLCKDLFYLIKECWIIPQFRMDS